MTLTTLEHNFSQMTLPQELQLSEGEFIKDVPKMIESHIAFLKANSGNMTFMPYFERLVRLKQILDKS